MFDSWAVLAWIQNESAASDVERLFDESTAAAEGANCSSINAGEVYYKLMRRQGEDVADQFWREAVSGRMPFRLHGVTDARIRRAAQIKAGFRVAYADAFAMGLAVELRQPLVTGDSEIRDAAQEAGVALEWLG